MSKHTNWFLSARKISYGPKIQRGSVLTMDRPLLLIPQEVGAECSGCDAPATGWDSFAVPFCCDTCRLAVETPSLPHCRCAFQASQQRVKGAAC